MTTPARYTPEETCQLVHALERMALEIESDVRFMLSPEGRVAFQKDTVNIEELAPIVLQSAADIRYVGSVIISRLRGELAMKQANDGDSSAWDALLDELPEKFRK